MSRSERIEPRSLTAHAAPDVPSVIVSQVNFHLQGHELNQLIAMFDPLQESDNYGIDLYLSVLELLNSF